jgi:hypothetical protein
MAPLIVLVIALLGGFSGCGGRPFYCTGYYGRGGLGLLLVIVLLLVLTGRIWRTNPALHRQSNYLGSRLRVSDSA